jgi:hypothetical protein
MDIPISGIVDRWSRSSTEARSREDVAPGPSASETAEALEQDTPARESARSGEKQPLTGVESTGRESRERERKRRVVTAIFPLLLLVELRRDERGRGPAPRPEPAGSIRARSSLGDRKTLIDSHGIGRKLNRRKRGSPGPRDDGDHQNREWGKPPGDSAHVWLARSILRAIFGG